MQLFNSSQSDILYLPLQPLTAQCMSMWSPVISCHLSARPLKWPLRMRTRLWAPLIHTHSRSRLFLHIAVRQMTLPLNMFFVFKMMFGELQKINLLFIWVISCAHWYVIAINVRIFLKKLPLGQRWASCWGCALYFPSYIISKCWFPF